MPEIGPVMRALELQRLVESKVTEWRERSARVAGPSVADSYQHNFKRHTNRRKNSAEINRIIAKYSRPIRRTDEHRYAIAASAPPVRPARKVKLKTSQSEDNLANIGIMDSSPMPQVEKPPRGIFSKYNAKSCEDITAFVDFQHTVKSKNFQENSILNSKTVTTAPRPIQYLHSISETTDMSGFDDSGLELRHKPGFATSTPISNRKTCPVSDCVSVIDFEKCPKYHSVSELKKGNSEPDILSGRSVESSRTLDFRKPLKLLKQPFKKGTLERILRWRGKKPGSDKNR